MLYQSRPFFRRIQKLTPRQFPTTRKAVTSHRTALGRKLTLHKTKRTRTPHQTTLTTTPQRYGAYRVTDVWLNLLGQGQYMTVVSTSGLTFVTPFLRGTAVGDYMRVLRIQGHILLSSYLIGPKNSQTLPLTQVCSGSARLGLKTTLFGVFKPSGLLHFTNTRLPQVLGSTSWFGFNRPLTVQHTGITSKVRGIAKNPVDHPNGGRANTKGSFKTPWGRIAKKGK